LASELTGTPIIPAFQPEFSEHPVADSKVPTIKLAKNKAGLICEIISFSIADLKRLQKNYKKTSSKLAIVDKHNTQFMVKKYCSNRERMGEIDSRGRAVSMASMSRIFLFLGVAFCLGSCTTEYDWPPESSPSKPTEARTLQ
jgi:hypothetical protein